MRQVALAALAVAMAFGVWTGIRYTYGVWAPDADIAAQVVLWDNFRQHGFSFFKTWNFTADNWLLTLTPLTSLIYTVFGTNPLVVIAAGWLIYAASVGTTTLLAYRVAGRGAALPVACVLLFPSFSAIGGAGFLSHPVTHNVSMAWALIALLLAHRAVARESPISAALAGACVAVDVVSDPWASPAIALPLILVSGFLAILNWRRRQGLFVAAVCVCVIVGSWAARTRLFGMLKFLPRAEFEITDGAGLAKNIGWMFRTLSMIFNIVPFAGIDNVVANIVGFVALSAILIGAATLTARAFFRTTTAQQLVDGVAILSIAGVGAAFMLYQWGEPTMIVGRFFPNIYYLGTLLVGTATARNWARLRIPIKLGFAAYGLLLIVSGPASAPELWTLQTPIRTAGQITQLGAFLEQNGLTYGYGPYWGAEALAMNWMTDGRVTIRPVSFDDAAKQVTNSHPQTSSLWYSPADVPAGIRETFLVVSSDGENCPLVAACVETAIGQFGEPSRRLGLNALTILVWQYPIGSKLVIVD